METNYNYQCIGCGAQIQTTDPQQAGYLPQSALKKGLESGEFYCQRCFKLRHYNELQDLPLEDDVFLDKLNEIMDDRAYIINVIDLFDFEGSLISGLQRFIGPQPYSVFINKFDLLPKGTRQGRTKQWAFQQLHAAGFRPQEIILGSATKVDTLQPLIELIEQQIKTRNVYIVGVTNVGKSTLINQLIHYYGGERELITTSNYPGTTLEMIKIPLGDRHALIDTPGIIRRSQLAHYLTPSSIQRLVPKKTIKPQTYQLNPEQTLFVEGVGRVDFTQGDQKTAFTFYIANSAKMYRTKLEGADDYYHKHVGGQLNPPTQEQVEDFPPLEPRTIQLTKGQDVAISGVGWFRTNHDAKVVVWAPKGVAIHLRPSLI